MGRAAGPGGGQVAAVETALGPEADAPWASSPFDVPVVPAEIGRHALDNECERFREANRALDGAAPLAAGRERDHADCSPHVALWKWSKAGAPARGAPP